MNTQQIVNEQHERVQPTTDQQHKDSVIEKIYTSNVFQEFMKQWGNASLQLEYVQANKIDKK